MIIELKKYNGKTKNNISKMSVISFVGVFIDEKGIISSDIQVLQRQLDVIDIFDNQAIQAFFHAIEGYFLLFYQREGVSIVANDRLNTYPVFYSFCNEGIVISDEANFVVNKCGPLVQNNQAIVDFILCGYVTGEQTLARGLHRLESGNCIVVRENQKKKIHIINCFDYIPRFSKKNETRNELNDTFYQILLSSFQRLAKYINEFEKIPVVPLSGGYDSRLIAVMLKKVGIQNAICYTYGTRLHPEVIKSKEIADRLGYEWKFCPYTKEKWDDVYPSTEMERFLRYSSGNSITPHTMDFIAVKELFSNYNESLLFLPGHTMDVIAGSHLPILSSFSFLPKYIVASLVQKKHYTFHEIYFREKMNINCRIKRQYKEIKKKYKIKSNEFFDFWDIKERQTKLIANSLQIYMFFGFDWYMPFWESEYVDFFLSLPPRLRYKQLFHKQVLHEKIPEFFPKFDVKKVSKWRLIIILIKELISWPFDDLNKMIQRKKYKFIQYRGLAANYGFNRFCAVDSNFDNLETFAKFFVKKTGIQRIFYFFAIKYLTRNDFDLSFLDNRYFKG